MNIVILAAGQGKRMHSNLPKVLHPVAGKALVAHVIDAAFADAGFTAPEHFVAFPSEGAHRE